MKKYMRLVIPFLVVALLAGAGYGGYRLYQNRQANLTWLDQYQHQIQAVVGQESQQRTVLTVGQQKKLIRLLKTLPDLSGAPSDAVLPQGEVAAKILLHFSNGDRMLYLIENSGTYQWCLSGTGFQCAEISQAQYEAVLHSVSEYLSASHTGNKSLKHWVDWKPLNASVMFPDAGTRPLTQEDLYAVTGFFRKHHLLSQELEKNKSLSSYMTEGWRFRDPADPVDAQGSSITVYYNGGFIRLVTIPGVPGQLFLLNDETQGLCLLDETMQAEWQVLLDGLHAVSLQKIGK